MEHICGNVYMGVILYKIMMSELFFKLTKIKKKMSFLDILPFPPSSAPEKFLRMSPGFIMSGGVRVIRSTYVPNSTI